MTHPQIQYQLKTLSCDTCCRKIFFRGQLLQSQEAELWKQHPLPLNTLFIQMNFIVWLLQEPCSGFEAHPVLQELTAPLQALAGFQVILCLPITSCTARLKCDQMGLFFFFFNFQSPVLSQSIGDIFIRIKLGSTPGNDSYFAHKKLSDDMLI